MMKIIIDRKIFADALSEVSPFAPTKPVAMILKYAKITTKGNRMKIEANDTQCSMVKYIETIECDQDGSFLISIAELNKFIAKVKCNAVTIYADDTAIRIEHSKGTAEFQSEKSELYPVFKMPKDELTEMTFDSKIIADAVNKGRNFIANDTLRPQMCAIYAYTEMGDKFGYCATDTHKLIHGWHVMEDGGLPEAHWMIMPQVFSALLTACRKSDSVKVSITESHVSYRVGDSVIQCVQPKGKYPDFKRVIPKEWNMECAVDKSELTDVLGRISLFCDQSGCVKMDISRMDMTVSVDNIDMMKKSVETIAHNGCDREMKIGVNISHLATSMTAFSDGEILMLMTDMSRPILMKQNDNPNLDVIVMPMSLNR